MSHSKNVFTTGEVAKICSVAPRTVSKWFDSGQLRGYRIPGSKDRRIPLEQLVRFMRAHGLPLNGLDGGHTRILALDRDSALWHTVADALGKDSGFEIVTASVAFEAGAIAQDIRPHVLIVDVTTDDIDTKSIAFRVHSMTDLHSTSLIGVGADLTEADGQALLQVGFDGYLKKPFDLSSLVKLIEALEPASVTANETV